LILGLYHEDDKKNLAFGATVKSFDGGNTWNDLALIGEKSGEQRRRRTRVGNTSAAAPETRDLRFFKD
jgi:hypothetical protein